MSGQWVELRRIGINDVYSLTVEQCEGSGPVLFVNGCDCAAAVDTPQLARDLALFLARWANEQDGGGDDVA